MQVLPGKHLLFIASVGDNFYWTGATLDAWEKTWAEPYGVNDANSPLYQIPWMSLRLGVTAEDPLRELMDPLRITMGYGIFTIHKWLIFMVYT